MSLFSRSKHKKPLSGSEFATLCRDALLQSQLAQSIDYDADQFCLYLNNRSHQINLANHYQHYRNAPTAAARESKFNEFIASILHAANHKASHLSFNQAKHNLLPGVRERSFVEPIRLMSQFEYKRNIGLATREIDHNLIALIQHNSDNHVSSLSLDVLAGWHINVDEAFALALDNLRNISTQAFIPIAPGFYHSPWQDEFDVSRILIPEILYRLSLQGDPVVSLPNRNTLLVCGHRDTQNLDRMATAASELLTQDASPLSGIALRYHNGTWQQFPANGHDESLLALWNLNQKWRVNQYNTQLTQIQQLFNKYAVDTKFSEVYAIESKGNGVIHTTCTWNIDSDDPALLPKTDYISFFKDSCREAIIVPWQKALPIVSPSLSETDFSPVRFSVQSPLCDSAWHQLTEHAI